MDAILGSLAAAQAGSPTPAEAAASVVTPDPETAALVARRAAGESLTPAEYGKLGAFSSKLKKLFGGKGGTPGAPAQPAQPGQQPGNAAGVGTMAQGETSGGGLVPPPADPRLVQRTTESLIKAIDGFARRKITSAARDAGATDKTLARFDSAASVPAPAKELMVDSSPDVAAALGINPAHCPIGAFIAGLGLWGTNIWLAVDELKAMKKKEEPAAAAPAPAVTAPGNVSFDPNAKPAGPPKPSNANTTSPKPE